MNQYRATMGCKYMSVNTTITKLDHTHDSSSVLNPHLVNVLFQVLIASNSIEKVERNNRIHSNDFIMCHERVDQDVNQVR